MCEGRDASKENVRFVAGELEALESLRAFLGALLGADHVTEVRDAEAGEAVAAIETGVEEAAAALGASAGIYFGQAVPRVEVGGPGIADFGSNFVS